MIKIGFIDHHLHNWHSDVFLKLLRGPIGEGMVDIVCAYESHPAEGMEDWCTQNHVTKVDSPEEVVAQSDVIYVLAPDNIDDHLELGRAAYMSGKPVLVDKYLSTNIEDAKEIIRLCKQSGSPMMSASSLRFSDELIAMLPKLTSQPKEVFSRGFGHWYPYSIHTVSQALAIFGDKADRIINTGTENASCVTIADGERRCTIEIYWAPDNHDEAMPWQAGAIVDNRLEMMTVHSHETIYDNMMRAAMEFIKTKKSPISINEMLLAVIIDELGALSLKQGNKWIEFQM